MSYAMVPSVPRDSTIASSMIVQDYIAKRFRGERPILCRHKPKGVDSCFGNFPPEYKRPDCWDGNPTLRRDSRTSYTSPNKSPAKPRRGHKGTTDVREVRGVIRGVGARPVTAGACRRPSRSGNAREGSAREVPLECGGRGLGRVTAAAAGAGAVAAGTRGARPKSASATSGRRHSSLERQHGFLSNKSAAKTRQHDVGEREEIGGGDLAASHEQRRRTRARPKTAGAVSSSSRERGSIEQDRRPDRQEWEATKTYLLTHGKFRTTPAKLLASLASLEVSRSAITLEGSRSTKARPVSAPAFARRRRPLAPPKAGAWRRRPIAATLFRKYYVRGDLPICVDHRGQRNGIRWTISPAELDFHVYLPIFFDGLREVEDPYRFLAVQGTLDMIEGAPEKVLPVIPQLVLPTKTALNTREPRIICPTLKILQQMILLCPMIGQALVPYYRQLLPVFNLFRGKNANMGDSIDYNQRARINIGELVMETLEVMEQFGGPDAFINIKYMIPTYESCGV